MLVHDLGWRRSHNFSAHFLVFHSLTFSRSPDIQTLADSLDNIPHFVLFHTDHNANCHNANHILRMSKNYQAESARQEFASIIFQLMRFSLLH
jgi:hypothetical protein